MKTATERTTTSRLNRAVGGMASGTLLSRATGFAKLAALGYALGEAHIADVYNLANNTPNIVYDLLIGGVLAGTVVPVFVDRLARGDEDRAWEDISAVLSLASAALAVATVVLVIAAPLVIDLYTGTGGGAAGLTERHDATFLLRLFAPQVALYALIGMATAVLNARRRFATPTFVPIANNVAVIAVLLAVRVLFPHPTLRAASHDPAFLLLLGIGTTGGVLVQALLLIPTLRGAAPRIGFEGGVDVVSTLARQPEVDPEWRSAQTGDAWDRLARLGRLADGHSPTWGGRRDQGRLALRWRWEPSNPAVSQILRLSGWTFGSVLATQVAYFVVLHLAYVGVGSGGVTAYTYAYTFFMLPVGIVAVSVMSAAQPELAQHWLHGDLAGFGRRSVAAIRAVIVGVIPPAVGYIVLSVPIAALELDHGAGTFAGSILTANALVGMAVGLPGFCAWLFLGSAFQAMQDTRTVFFYYLLETGLNIVLALLLQPFLGVEGLGFALSGSYTLTALVGWAGLRYRLGASGGAHSASGGRHRAGTPGGQLDAPAGSRSARLGVGRALVRVCILSAIMAGVVFEVAAHVGSDHGLGDLIRVVVSVGAGLAVFVGGTAIASRLARDPY